VNPFVQVYNALWDLLEAHAGLTDLVPVGNRIKMVDDNRDPIKDQISSADVPELRLVPIGGTPHIFRTSSSSSCIKRYEIQISSGHQTVEMLYNVEWEILRAMMSWIPTLMDLTWEGKKFVKLVRPGEMPEGVTSQDLNRGIVGWSTLWACEVTMWFHSDDLKP